jgi:hypothetical protein
MRPVLDRAPLPIRSNLPVRRREGYSAVILAHSFSVLLLGSAFEMLYRRLALAAVDAVREPTR